MRTSVTFLFWTCVFAHVFPNIRNYIFFFFILEENSYREVSRDYFLFARILIYISRKLSRQKSRELELTTNLAINRSLSDLNLNLEIYHGATQGRQAASSALPAPIPEPAEGPIPSYTGRGWEGCLGRWPEAP